MSSPPGPSGTHHTKYTLEPLLASNLDKSFQQRQAVTQTTQSHCLTSWGLSPVCAFEPDVSVAELQAFILGVSQSHDIDTARTISARTDLAGCRSIPGDKVSDSVRLSLHIQGFGRFPVAHPALALAVPGGKGNCLDTGGLHTQNA